MHISCDVLYRFVLVMRLCLVQNGNAYLDKPWYIYIATIPYLLRLSPVVFRNSHFSFDLLPGIMHTSFVFLNAGPFFLICCGFTMGDLWTCKDNALKIRLAIYVLGVGNATCIFMNGKCNVPIPNFTEILMVTIYPSMAFMNKMM